MSDAPEYDNDYDDYEEELSEEDAAAQECGRWRNGNLVKQCLKAGSEECDWICPYSR